MDVAAVMEELAAKLRAAPSLAGRTYAWPVGAVTPPAAIVVYPSEGTPDATYGRGVDTMTGVVVVVAGLPTERQTRDRLAKYLNGSGPESVIALLDGDSDTYASCDGVRVSRWETDVWQFGENPYLVAIFQLAIEGPGTA